MTAEIFFSKDKKITTKQTNTRMYTYTKTYVMKHKYLNTMLYN